MKVVLVIIALQQGLFAAGWWLAGRRLGLSRRPAAHWVAATLGSALSLVFILQRGHWPDWLTIVVANVLAMGAFLAMRRGVQLFLHIPVRDREAAVLMAGVGVTLGVFLLDTSRGRVAVLGTSTLVAWTLLRCAWEARQALREGGDTVTARIVAAPLALLGAVYTARVAYGLVRPDVAAVPISEENGFNATVVVAFLVVGLLLNLVLAYLVASRLVRRLHELSIRDPLTGLLNRRGLDPRLSREAARWRRYGEPYALLMVDVDRFKAVNDRHGHAAGDAVLVRLAKLLREVARDVDTVARVGGEEFCLLLPHCEPEGARTAAERLRQKVRQFTWPAPAGPVTVSVGVAVSEGAGAPISVLARADGALLQAKNEGRDRVVVSGF